MPIDVTAFSALARSEFMKGKIESETRVNPASIDQFTTKLPSTVKVETHTFMSSLPRLAEFMGSAAGSRMISKEYQVTNKTFRVGPLTVSKENLDDDQVGGFLLQTQGLYSQGLKDIQYKALEHLAAGTTNLCFDGTAFFADSHTIGSGDNKITADNASNDAVTHRIIALRTDNGIIKPVIFQDRESLSSLMTDADTPAALKQREFEYWADCRFGLGYGYWWDGVNVAITDTPTVAECYTIVESIINAFRSFTLPKGKDTDAVQYVHEGWVPNPTNFVLLCNMKLGAILTRAIAITQYVASTGNVDNVYKDIATVIPSSALGA